MQRIAVYILAGGRSSRFGSDKARATLGGRPLILHVRNLLEPVAAGVTVVADKPGKYADLGLRTIADQTPGCGPLGGLKTALTDLADEATLLLLCSCDAAVMEPHWLHTLLAHADRGADVVAFKNDAAFDGRGRTGGLERAWQPMPALYARTLLPLVEQQLRRQQFSMQRLLDQARAVCLPLPDDWPDAWQVNTRHDLAAHDSADAAADQAANTPGGTAL